jgi:hypothetical protein
MRLDPKLSRLSVWKLRFSIYRDGILVLQFEYENEYKWLRHARRPLHPDYFLIYCTFLIFSIVPVVLYPPQSTVSCITMSSWSLGSMKCLPKWQGLNSAKPHTHRTCEAVSVWVLLRALLLYAPGIAVSRPSFWLPFGTSRQLGLPTLEAASFKSPL